MPPRRTHWLNDIAASVIKDAHASAQHVGSGIKDAVPFGPAPLPPPKPQLDQFLQADPQTRQAFLSGLGPDYGKVVSQLMDQANSRFGAMSAKLLPMFQMDNMAQQLPALESQDPSLGVAAAQADLQELLGVDMSGGPQQFAQ